MRNQIAAAERMGVRAERIARTLPANLRLLATTATANDRVMSDLREILT